MRLVAVKHVTNHNWVKMRKRMRDGADPRNGYGDKIRHFNDATS